MPNSSMILTAHQPVYLPWLGLLHKIALSDHFVHFDDVQYQDRDWNNRNKIKTNSGLIWLTVPVHNKNHFEIKLKDVEIVADDPWRKKHWRSISLAYSKAPFAKTYLPWFEDLYKKEWRKLSDLNEYVLKFLLDDLGIKVGFSKLSEMKLESKKSQLVLDMCLAKGAKLYIFGEQGANYADREAFKKADVDLEFQSYHHPTYTQLHGEFVSHLTAFDLLLNHGPQSLDILMSANLSKDELFRKRSEASTLS